MLFNDPENALDKYISYALLCKNEPLFVDSKEDKYFEFLKKRHGDIECSKYLEKAKEKRDEIFSLGEVVDG